MTSARPITARRLDLLYLIFFTIHIPVILLIDIVPFYPEAWAPSASVTIRKYYISTYRDRFFIDPPPWFKTYAVLEAIYHLPISLWMLGALVQGWYKPLRTMLMKLTHMPDHQLLPVHLLIFGVQTGITTLTCLVEMLNWQGYTNEEFGRLCSLYVPYLAVGTNPSPFLEGLSVALTGPTVILMTVDAFLRLKRVLAIKAKQS